MGKVTYEFNMADTEDDEELKIFMQSKNMYNVIVDFSEYLRRKLKHDNLSEEDYKMCEEIRETWTDMLEKENIDLLY